MPPMVELLLVLFTFFSLWMVLVLWKVGGIPGNWLETQEQNCVALFLGSEIPAGFHYKNLILLGI